MENGFGLFFYRFERSMGNIFLSLHRLYYCISLYKTNHIHGPIRLLALWLSGLLRSSNGRTVGTTIRRAFRRSAFAVALLHVPAREFAFRFFALHPLRKQPSAAFLKIRLVVRNVVRNAVQGHPGFARDLLRLGGAGTLDAADAPHLDHEDHRGIGSVVDVWIGEEIARPEFKPRVFCHRVTSEV